MPQIAYAPPDSVSLTGPADAALRLVEAFEIDSPEMYREAGSEVMTITQRWKDLEAQRDGIVRPLNTAIKAVNDLFRPALTTLDSAKRLIGGKMDAYNQEQKRIADEQRRKAEDEARRERARLAAEAAEAEAKAVRQAQEMRAQAAQAAAAGDTERAAKLESRADSKQEAGEQRAMNLQMEAAAVTALPLPAAPLAKVAGFAGRSVWKARVTNKAKLVAFIVANPQYMHLIDISDKELNALAKALKEHWNLDGSQSYEDRSFSVRTA